MRMVHNSEKHSLYDLSFVLESISRDKEECDLAPAFKSLTNECKGKPMEIGVDVQQTEPSCFYLKIRFYSNTGAEW